VYRPDTGYIEVICGPMFCGKSTELMRILKREKIAKRKVQVFKPKIDNRYSKGNITNHDGQELNSEVVCDSAELFDSVTKDTEVIGIDEINFFDAGIEQVCVNLAKSGKKVIIAGLDTNFRGEPFNQSIANLLARAEFVTKLQAVCVKCGAPATRTQRLVNGRPAKKSDPLILVGGHEAYEARCARCHEIDS